MKTPTFKTIEATVNLHHNTADCAASWIKDVADDAYVDALTIRGDAATAVVYLGEVTACYECEPDFEKFGKVTVVGNVVGVSNLAFMLGYYGSDHWYSEYWYHDEAYERAEYEATHDEIY